ncbi:beta-lactamase family protein [Skermanella mucosa]|uniref:serine hydrolase domain-containing protein n=1 Tax=Skermanella mucosa TaxID=1789672 RepID=UPI00192B440B|nr:serine hydrolase [Skermanella mucosa]UEM22747.1 beta-lactamase family protein [Skermanella mucosa]
MPTMDASARQDLGFAEDLDERIDLARQAGCLPNVHGIVAARGGRIVCERYWPGLDDARGRPLGIVRFGPETLHDLRSITKSIVGLLYGIALAAGHVPPPDAVLIDQFPEFPDLAGDPERRALRVEHALTMTLGLEWDELTLSYADPRNSEIAMDRAADRHRFVLERPVIHSPGECWTYNGGATALLARLIVKGTGRSLPDFARESLFEPLGIGRAEWHRSASGEVFAASGLRLALRDLVRIGVMLLDGGRWQERGVVPKEWLNSSFRPAVGLPDGRRYGYHWYLGAVPMDDGAGGIRWEEMVNAIGYGGQRLFLLPRLDLVVAVFAGNYGTSDQWLPPLTVLRDLVLPAMRVP